MRLLISTAIALTAALVAAVPTIDLAAAPAQRATNIKVIVSFQNGAGDKIQGVGGPYQDGVGGVVAYLAANNNGALTFSTNAFNTAGRTLQFFFDDCLSSPEDCTAPWPSLNEKSGLLANVSRNGVVPPGGMTGMAINEELPAWIKIDIPLDTDPAFWNVCFDSRKMVGPCGAAPGGTSTDAHIRRDTASQWTVFADAVNDRADLVRDSDTRKSRTFTLMGTYSMPFSFTVQCVNANCS